MSNEFVEWFISTCVAVYKYGLSVRNYRTRNRFHHETRGRQG